MLLHTNIVQYKHIFVSLSLLPYLLLLSFLMSIYLTALGLSCGMQNLVPQPGIAPWSSALGSWSLSHWTTRKSRHAVSLPHKYPKPIPSGRPIWDLFSRLPAWLPVNNCFLCCRPQGLSTGLPCIRQTDVVQLPGSVTVSFCWRPEVERSGKRLSVIQAVWTEAGTRAEEKRDLRYILRRPNGCTW